ncbi:MAG: putative nucleic acid-binding protein [Candidatus Latescibacterota bacterium]|jgi:predicted nucleic acid-binding protein
MKILIDTCIWSLALRRAGGTIDDPFVLELNELINELRVQMIGPIRQEILSGIRVSGQYEALRNHLQAFDDLPLTMGDYERAADFYNQLRSKGVQGSNTDFLICAVSDRYKMPILTIDEDFSLFKEYVPITLHTPRF